MKITRKDFEYDNLSTHDKSTKISLITAFIFLLILLWSMSDFLAIKIIFTIILIAAVPLIFFELQKNQKKFINSEMYIVEDVFINAYLKESLGAKGRYRPYIRRDYRIKFSKYGEYKLPDYRKKKLPDEPDFIDLTIHSSKPGDKFYLIISEKDNCKNIYKFFNSNFYSINEEDFTLIDGKYYLKQHSEIQGENNGR